MAVIFKKVVMAGVGLICGSLALDMRRRNLVKQIIGFGRSEANLRTAVYCIREEALVAGDREPAVVRSEHQPDEDLRTCLLYTSDAADIADNTARLNSG